MDPHSFIHEVFVERKAFGQLVALYAEHWSILFSQPHLIDMLTLNQYPLPKAVRLLEAADERYIGRLVERGIDVDVSNPEFNKEMGAYDWSVKKAKMIYDAGVKPSWKEAIKMLDDAEYYKDSPAVAGIVSEYLHNAFIEEFNTAVINYAGPMDSLRILLMVRSWASSFIRYADITHRYDEAYRAVKVLKDVSDRTGFRLPVVCEKYMNEHSDL